MIRSISLGTGVGRWTDGSATYSAMSLAVDWRALAVELMVQQPRLEQLGREHKRALAVELMVQQPRLEQLGREHKRALAVELMVQQPHLHALVINDLRALAVELMVQQPANRSALGLGGGRWPLNWWVGCVANAANWLKNERREKARPETAQGFAAPLSPAAHHLRLSGIPQMRGFAAPLSPAAHHLRLSGIPQMRGFAAPLSPAAHHHAAFSKGGARPWSCPSASGAGVGRWTDGLAVSQMPQID